MLTDEQQEALEAVTALRDVAASEYRHTVLWLLREGCSFNEVSKATGLSKDTLQRWKREAGK